LPGQLTASRSPAAGRVGAEAPHPAECDLVTMRTQPQQRRAAERVELLLDATAALVGELGFERLTTQAVAERSGMSIGSVYRYFPDRRSLARALAQRNLERFGVRVVAALEAAGGARDWWHIVDTAIDEFVAMHHDEPGFRALRFGDVIDEVLLDEASPNNAVLGDGLLVLGEALLGIERTDELSFATRIATEIVDALLRHAFREDPKGDARVVATCKVLVHDHLARLLGPGADPPEA
jgi:AcrR family transcriptional regulator